MKFRETWTALERDHKVFRFTNNIGWRAFSEKCNQMESLVFHNPLAALPLIPLHADEFSIDAVRFSRFVDIHIDTVGVESLAAVTLALERHGLVAFSPYEMFATAVSGDSRLDRAVADVLAIVLPNLFEERTLGKKTVSEVIRATQMFYERKFRGDVARMKVRYGY